jgi:hypothetical protein
MHDFNTSRRGLVTLVGCIHCPCANPPHQLLSYVPSGGHRPNPCLTSRPPSFQPASGTARKPGFSAPATAKPIQGDVARPEKRNPGLGPKRKRNLTSSLRVKVNTAMLSTQINRLVEHGRGLRKGDSKYGPARSPEGFMLKIKAKNIWDMDEKGFGLACGRRMRRVVAHFQKREVGSKEAWQREFLIFIECINTDGKYLRRASRWTRLYLGH